MSFKHQLFEMLREREESQRRDDAESAVKDSDKDMNGEVNGEVNKSVNGGREVSRESDILEGDEMTSNPAPLGSDIISGLSQYKRIDYHGREWTYYLIDSERECDRILPILKRASRYYIDTEFQGFKQNTILSLLQISVGDELFVIDSYHMGPYRPLAACLARSGVEWVLHDARIDIPLLCDFYEIPCPTQVLDTQVAWGFQHTLSQIGLALLAHTKLRMHVDKSFQSAQFLKRPLPAEWVEYAACDLPPLIGLTEVFLAELSPAHLKGARAHSLERVWISAPHLDPNCSEELVSGGGARRAPNAPIGLSCPLNATPRDPRFFEDLREFSFHLWSLTPPQLQCLRLLKEWRAGAAPKSNLARSFPQTKQWLRIARCAPQSVDELRELQGMHAHWLNDHGSSLIVKLNQAIAPLPTEWSDAPDAAWSESLRPSPVLEDRAEPQMLKLWLDGLILRCARKLMIAPEYLVPPSRVKRVIWPAEWFELQTLPDPETLWTHIIEQLPSVNEGWRREVFMDTFRAAVIGYTSPLRL